MPWNVVFEAAFASSLISLLTTKFVHLAITEISNTRHAGRNLSTLADRARDIQMTLDGLGVGEEELSSHSMMRECVAELTKLFYEVDDIIDGINLDIMIKNHIQAMSGHQPECSSRILKQLHGVLTNDPNPPSETMLRNMILKSLKNWGLPHKISSLHRKLDSIEQKVATLVGRASATNRASTSTSTSAATQPAMGIRVPIASFSVRAAPMQLAPGREHAMEKIITRLIRGRGVSIVGMAGLGKTTLARAIRWDDRVRSHFDSIIWASVPGGVFAQVSNLDLQHQTHTKTVDKRKRRTLVVLDGLSAIHYRAWETFLAYFGESDNGNVTVLITTVNPQVASDTNTRCHHLEFLSDRDCEELIKNSLPGRVRDHYGHRISCIARKCAGLPLAADVLGLAMCSGCRSEDPESVISRFERIDLWKTEVFREQIFPYLRFQETLDPPEVNKYLAYLSLFPLVYRFKKHEVCQLWMAEGFVHPEEWNAEGFDNASQCFDNVLSKSILYPPNNALSEAEETTHHGYQIHEFIHRFAQSFAHNKCRQVREGENLDQFRASHIRHLSIIRQDIGPDFLENKIKKHCEKLRTFLLLHEKGCSITQVPEPVFHTLKLLRVLKLGRSNITHLPISISNLKHLRYLDFSHTNIQTLPVTICSLVGLRVLKLQRCRHLLRLPPEISNLVNLIHLDVDMISLPEPPARIGQLTKLRSLNAFRVQNEQGYRISELSRLNDLQGSVRLMMLENVTNIIEAQNARLADKPFLKALELQWTETEEIRSMIEQAAVRGIVERLQPHGNLTDLKLINYRGDRFPRWLSSRDSLCHLNSIHLENCPMSSIQSAEFWKLRSLKTLFIDNVPEWEIVCRRFFGTANDSHRFARLEKLKFQNMEKLIGWEEMEPGNNVMPRLRRLELVRCRRLSSLPRLAQLNEPSTVIEIADCPELQKVKQKLPSHVTYHGTR